jgi:hypothetical protein
MAIAAAQVGPDEAFCHHSGIALARAAGSENGDDETLKVLVADHDVVFSHARRPSHYR